MAARLLQSNSESPTVTGTLAGGETPDQRHGRVPDCLVAVFAEKEIEPGRPVVGIEAIETPSAIMEL